MKFLTKHDLEIVEARTMTMRRNPFLVPQLLVSHIFPSPRNLGLGAPPGLHPALMCYCP